MATKKIEIQDHQGNVYHPHTDANVVYMPDGKTVKEALESLKLSVSNGKSSIATAITGKGVAASSNDSFSTLATKIGKISTGKKWATGKAQTNTTNVEGAITVSGLSFRPSIVIMCGNRGRDDLMIGGLYVQGHQKNRNIAYYYNQEDFDGGIGSRAVGNSTNDECYIVDNGFRLLANWVNIRHIYNITWYAFE